MIDSSDTSAAPNSVNAPESIVSEVRAFNRFITRRIGALQEGLLQTLWSLTEARVLFELGQRDDVTATDLTRELGLDPGYISLVLRGLEDRSLLEKTRADTDARKRLLALTDAGREAFAPLDGRSRQEVSQALAGLSDGERSRLMEAMRTIKGILTDTFRYAEPFVLRPPEPGDLGWVVQRHGAIYAREYGWDTRLEALVARIIADFVAQHNLARERCWIAERDGQPVGCVFVVRGSPESAKLRLLLVDPAARELGIGGRLIDEVIHFARRVGYHDLTLWTNGVLVAARRLYVSRGFQLVTELPHEDFGVPLVGEEWRLQLHR